MRIFASLIFLLCAGFAAAGPPPRVEARCFMEYWCDESANWRAERYTVESEDFDAQWFLGGRRIGSGRSINVLRRADAPALELRRGAGADFRMDVPEPVGEGGRPRNLECFFDFQVPDIIYDDYPYDFSWSVTARLILDYDFQVDIIPDRQSAAFGIETFKFKLDGVPESRPFAAGNTYRDNRKLSVVDLREKLALTFEIRLPGARLARRGIVFLPAAQFSDVLCAPDGHFYNSEGDRVIAVLHRRSVGESRTLELPRLLNRLPLGKQRTLVIAEDFGVAGSTLSGELGKLCEASGMDLLFVPWRGREGGTTDQLWGDYERILALVRHADVDRVVLLAPPPRRRKPGSSVEEQARMLELTAQLALENPSVRRVVIASALPEYGKSGSEPLTGLLRNSLRGSGIEFCELERRFRRIGGWPEFYRIGAGESSSEPVMGAKEIAGIIFDNCL